MFIVFGHFTPTDESDTETWGDQLGKLDKDCGFVVCATREGAEQATEWYTDGIIIGMSIAES